MRYRLLKSKKIDEFELKSLEGKSQLMVAFRRGGGGMKRATVLVAPINRHKLAVTPNRFNSKILVFKLYSTIWTMI